jgi:hypothetical protein
LRSCSSSGRSGSSLASHLQAVVPNTRWEWPFAPGHPLDAET